MGKISKRHILSIALTLAMGTSCSHWEHASRDIAAQQSYDELMQNPNYNIAFREIFSDQDATKRYLEFFNRLGRMYYRNQALIYEFDDKLAAGEDPMKTSLYQEIWVARDLKDHLEDKMVFHVLKLREMEQTGSDEEAKKARIILGSMARILNQMEDHEKVPFIDVLTRINSYTNVSGDSANKKGFSRHSMMDEVISPFDDFMDGDFDWADFYRENGDKIKAATLERVKSKKFYQAIEEAGDSSRTPNAILVYPSTGDAGNMYGHRLPSGTWALTYDDGPRRETTRAIMDELDDAGVKATFFWLAQNAGRYQDMVQKGLDLDMDLANHSYSHANVPKLSRRGIEHEILESTDTLEALYGRKIKFFRLPYGSGHKNSTIRSMIASRGMIHAYWSVDSLDWQDKNPRTIFNRVQKQMERDGRGIILFHDIHSQTVEVTKMMMDYIREQNRYGEKLRFLKMSDIVAELNSDQTPSAPPAPAGSYQVRTDLNVRTGFSSSAPKCAVLPQGTVVTVSERRGSYVRVSVHNPSYGLARDLGACGGATMVHGDYLIAN